jgi:hypothetical protein
MNRNSSVQSDPVSFNGTPQRSLFDQMSGPLSLTFVHVSVDIEQPMCLRKSKDLCGWLLLACHINVNF